MMHALRSSARQTKGSKVPVLAQILDRIPRTGRITILQEHGASLCGASVPACVSMGVCLCPELLIHPDQGRASRRICYVSAHLPIRSRSCPVLRVDMATSLITALAASMWFC